MLSSNPARMLAPFLPLLSDGNRTLDFYKKRIYIPEGNCWLHTNQLKASNYYAHLKQSCQPAREAASHIIVLSIIPPLESQAGVRHVIC